MPAPRLIWIDPSQPDASTLREAAAALRRGALVVFPTETVYGLAADAAQPRAMNAIYGAKGRPADKPIALFAADVAQVRATGVAWSATAERLATKFWPGPLTLVLDRGNEQVGFRIPNHAVPLGLLREFGGALAVTSANRSGEQPVRDGEEALATFAGQDVVILDAGPVGGGVPSTVVGIAPTGWKILRPGAISEADIRTIAG